jgi:histidinol-phosphate aminotransferase
MSSYWNEKTRRLLPYVPGEQPRDRKYIKLNTNENPYPPSPMVIGAIQKAATETLKLYPDPTCMEFREAVAARYGIKTTQVFPGNGSDEVLAFAFAAFFGSSGEDVLLFPDISYSFYPVYADLWDIPYRTVPLREDFSIEPGDYLGKSGGIIFPNPNAPTGVALSLEAVKKIAGAAERNKRVLVLDEAYIAFANGEDATEGNFGSALPLLKDFPNLLVVRTLSKEASLAGLRAGYAIGSEELIEGLFRIKDSFNSYPLDRLALAGAAAAIMDSSYYDGINRRVIATRRRVSLRLKELGFRVLPSQANFIFAAPPASGGKSGQEFYAALRERGILVRHFSKPRISGFLRISIGTDNDMDALLEACSEILRN